MGIRDYFKYTDKIEVIATMALCALGAFTLGAFTIREIEEIELYNFRKDLNIKEDEFNKVVSAKASRHDFKGSNAKLIYDNEKDSYSLNLFGSSENKFTNKRNFENILFNLNKDDAVALLKAMSNKNILDKELLTYNNKEISDVVMNSKIARNAISKEKLDAYIDVYTYLTNAVANAYNFEVSNVKETDIIKNTVYDNYYKQNHKIKRHDIGVKNNDFTKKGMLLTGISNVYNYNDEYSFFYVNTIQTLDGKNFENCKAIVRVDDVNLTSSEVYQKFIEGKHILFKEISRENVKDENIDMFFKQENEITM